MLNTSHDSEEEEDTRTYEPEFEAYGPIALCGECGLPAEYCEVNTKQWKKACRHWHLTHGNPMRYPDSMIAAPKKQKPQKPQGRFLRWPKIFGFSHVCHAHRKLGMNLRYRGKPKLHGTNAAVVIGQSARAPLFVQTRKRILMATGQGHHGLYKWCLEKYRHFFSLIGAKYPSETVVLRGEWCGCKIMNNAAICELPYNALAVFAVELGQRFICEPQEICAVLQVEGAELPPDIFVLPWATDVIDVSLADEQNLQLQVDAINAQIVEIDREDPFVRGKFGISGPGEGLVFYPVDGESFEEFAWKAKGSSHQVRQGPSVSIRCEMPTNAVHFASMVCTPARLEQMAQGQSKLKSFLHAFWFDVKEEAALELASLPSREDAELQVRNLAAEWFKAQQK